MSNLPLFESLFKAELATLTENTSLTGNLWSEIQTNYSNPNRYYHNLEHLNNMVATLLPFRNQVEDWQVLIFSIAYHDIIYDPSRHDNEERSSRLAVERLTEVSLAHGKVNKCEHQILATKHHQAAADQDTNFLIDADLSILGEEQPIYSHYAAQIRKEYSHVPDHFYKAGRGNVLELFLQMENIFKTEHFQSIYEAQARINIAEELRSLA